MSGYEVDAETVCEILRNNGRMAFRGLGDEGDGKCERARSRNGTGSEASSG